MEKCHMATSWKVKHSLCFHSRKELAAWYQSCYKLVPQQAQHPSEEAHATQWRHFWKKAHWGRWHCHLHQPLSQGEGCSILHHTTSPLKRAHDPSRATEDCEIKARSSTTCHLITHCWSSESRVVETIPLPEYTAIMALHKGKWRSCFSNAGMHLSCSTHC